MLLDVKITGFDALSFDVDDSAIDAFKARNKGLTTDITDYLAGADNMLDAESIAGHLFPVQHADVFLSHTHQDHDAVVKLAVTLERLGMKVFVDSCIWGDVYDLLLKVDKARSPIPGKPNTYYYERTVRTAANMYMILNVALQRMIHNTELLMFLESKAVRVEDYVEGKAYIGSPWIFSELMFARMVKRRARPTPAKGLENFKEAVARTADAAPAPLVRYRLPESAHTMAASDLCTLMANASPQATLARMMGTTPDKNVFLDAFYTSLPVTAAERRLLRWPPLPAQPAR